SVPRSSKRIDPAVHLLFPGSTRPTSRPQAPGGEKDRKAAEPKGGKSQTRGWFIRDRGGDHREGSCGTAGERSRSRLGLKARHNLPVLVLRPEHRSWPTGVEHPQKAGRNAPSERCEQP